MSESPSFDVSKLPQLESPEFYNIITWAAAIRNSLRRIHPKPTFPAGVVIDTSVVDLCLRLATATKFPEDLEEAIALLCKTFKPQAASAQLAIIKRVRWSHSTPRSGEYNVSSAMVAFNAEFDRVATALGLDDAPALKFYLEALHGDVARLINTQLRITPVARLSDLYPIAINCAARIDAAAADGFLAASSTPSQAKAKGTVEANPPSRPRTGAPARRPQKMTPAEYTRCLAEGRCLRCREQGHLAANCPIFNETTAPTTQAAAQHTAAAAQPPRAVPQTAQQPAGNSSRYPVRSRQKPDYYKPESQTRAIRVIQESELGHPDAPQQQRVQLTAPRQSEPMPAITTPRPSHPPRRSQRTRRPYSRRACQRVCKH